MFTFLWSSLLWAQPQRQEKLGIGYVEIKFKDSSQTRVMLWDDFTFEYSENHSVIQVVEGGSKDKYTYKAKVIDFIRFIHENEIIELHQYKSPRGRDYLLIAEVHRNGDYAILQSPHFAEPVFYYLSYKNEVFSILPSMNLDFLEFFNCPSLNESFGTTENRELSLVEMKIRLDLYLKNCLSKEENTEVQE